MSGIFEGHLTPSMANKDHTLLSVRREFAIIDPETRELRSHIQEILEAGKVTLKERSSGDAPIGV